MACDPTLLKSRLVLLHSLSLSGPNPGFSGCLKWWIGPGRSGVLTFRDSPSNGHNNAIPTDMAESLLRRTKRSRKLINRRRKASIEKKEYNGQVVDGQGESAESQLKSGNSSSSSSSNGKAGRADDDDEEDEYPVECKPHLDRRNRADGSEDKSGLLPMVLSLNGLKNNSGSNQTDIDISRYRDM